MAYIVGILSIEEEAILRRRGWEVEDAPKELVPAEAENADRYRMTFIDTSMFEIMSGPDWDTEEEEESPEG